MARAPPLQGGGRGFESLSAHHHQQAAVQPHCSGPREARADFQGPRASTGKSDAYDAHMRCLACGQDNPDRAKFCLECGASLTQVAELSTESRRVVSVVFADMAGSTAMGERLDPEALRRVQARYFDAMAEVIERHGGTVEKYRSEEHTSELQSR